MKLLRTATIALACLLPAASAVPAAYRITYDLGGSMDEYVEKYTSIRMSGGSIIIDGMCLSACALVAALMPADRVCVTQFARLGFHSVDLSGSFGRRYDLEFTRLYFRMLPSHVRALVNAAGWDGESEHPAFVYIDGDELRSIFPSCQVD